MKNKLSDLNDHLYAQLERLSDEELKGDLLKEECLRSRSIEGVADCIIQNATLALNICREIDNGMCSLGRVKLPPMLEAFANGNESVVENKKPPMKLPIK
jgi:hypothetical protein